MSKMPQHIAIIMDGNNRWAKENKKSLEFAYRKGAEAADKIISESSKLGIKYLTLYAFSLENWSRPADEITLIMSIFKEYMFQRIESNSFENIRIIFIGDRSKISNDVVELMNEIERLSNSNSGLTVIIAVSYGSRQEITKAAFDIAKDFNDFEDFCKKLENNINPHNLPDPDLLIRTSNEMRVSNFLLWQIAYTEFYFTDVLWPDFDEDDLHNALNEFKLRNRRFGTR
jgi:undecaprenyl diphosphate synthase